MPFSLVLCIGMLFGITHADLKGQDSVSETDSTGNGDTMLLKAAGVTTAWFAVSMFVLGKTWYKDREVVPFHFYNDNAAWMQVDKCGHAFGAYVYSYVGYHGMLAAGMSRGEALAFGATLGAVLQTPIEIMDALHEGYGFSWGDIAANSFGSALVLGQELLFDGQPAKYKFSYRPSPYADYAQGALGVRATDRILKDYNGQTYWLSFPAEAIIPDRSLPPWLNIAVGYGADGMYGEFSNTTVLRNPAVPYAVRSRQYLISLDIDWTRIDTDSPLLRLLLQGLTFIKLPFPAIEYNSHGGLKAYWMYF